MGYGVIPIIAAILLAIHHVVVTDASRTSKIVMTVTVVVSLVIWQYYPRRILFATLLQVTASIYMLVYLRLHATDD